jgi:hypothetical protein
MKNYQKYSDYKNRAFTPEKMQSDANLFVKKLMPTFCNSWINQVEEQSDELKGIKFEFIVKSETIQVIKLGGFLGDWDLFLNKKRISKTDLTNFLEKKYMTGLEIFCKYVMGYNFHLNMLEYNGDYVKVSEKNKNIESIFAGLNDQDKAKAIDFMNSVFGEKLTKRVFSKNDESRNELLNQLNELNKTYSYE